MKGAHPYEEPAYDIYEISGRRGFGIGLWGKVDNVWQLEEFTRWVKDKLQAKYVRLIKSNDRKNSEGSFMHRRRQFAYRKCQQFRYRFIYYRRHYPSPCSSSKKNLKLNILEIEHFVY